MRIVQQRREPVRPRSPVEGTGKGRPFSSPFARPTTLLSIPARVITQHG